MTSPAVFLERWPASPGAEATVPAGAPGGPGLAGMAENWVMGGGWAGFPAADSISDSTLPRLFRVFDPDDPREIMRVRQTAGSAWLVVRGDQGTLPVVHRPGFTVRPFITAAGLGALAQGVPSRDGLVLPNRKITWTTNPATGPDYYYGVAALDGIPVGEISRGCTYELLAWGRFTIGTSLGGNGPSFNSAFYYSGYYNAVMLGEESNVGQIICPLGGTRTNARFRLHGLISLYPGRVTTSVTVCLSPNRVAPTGGLPEIVQPAQVRMFGPDTMFAERPSPPDPAAVALVIMLKGNAPANFDVHGAKAWRSG